MSLKAPLKAPHLELRWPLWLCGWLLCTLTACGAHVPTEAQSAAERRAAPSWYVSPPAATPAELYGVGEGRTHEESVAKALGQIAAQLHVTLQARVRSRVRLKHGVETEEGSIDSELEVATLELHGYELLEREALSPLRYLSLVRVSKPKLARDLWRSTERDIKSLEAQLSPSLSALEALRRCAEAEVQLTLNRRRLATLQSLSEAIEAPLQRLDALERRCDERSSQVVIELRPRGAQAARAHAALSAYLTGEGLRVIKSEGGARGLALQVRLQEQLTEPMGFKVARWEVTLQLLEGTQLRVSHSLSVVGQSGASAEHARQVAQAKLTEELEALGVEALLGLKR